MFGRKKPEPPKRRDRDLSQFGLFEIPDDFDPATAVADDGGDSEFEAELAAITSGGKPKAKPKPKPQLIPSSDLDKMIADSMKDIGSDEELSGDDDDPDLLGELQEIAGVEMETNEQESAPAPQPEEPPQVFLPTTTNNVAGLIKERIEMYKLAEANAKATGEAGRARRFNRGLKTLQDMLKQTNAGKSINVDEIPPEVSVKGAQPQPADAVVMATDDKPEEVKSPSRPAPAPPVKAPLPQPNPVATPSPKAANPKLVALNARKQEYKIAALTAKRSGDTQSALQFVKMIKQFDLVIKSAEDGQEVDLSDMPPPPDQFKAFMEQMQAGGGAPAAAAEPAPTPPQPEAPAEPIAEPRNLLEALEQRLAKYKSVEQAAKAEDNSSKARRFGRIVKQYEDAIKAHKKGKPIPLDELPTPPGFGPLPTEGGTPATSTTSPTPAAPPPVPPRAAAASATPSQSTSSTSVPSTPSETPKVSPNRPAPPAKQELTTRISGNQVSTNLAERQMQILIERQKEFKLAAIEAKKAGEIEQAKEYLKIYKGFEGLLNAASSGLPVDLSTLPIPPSQRETLEDSFAIVNDTDCDPNDEISDISVRLEEQLAKQLMMCKNTRDHHKAMGDVAGMNRFENLALTVQKDLDLVRYSRTKKFPIPKFHYEQKSFNIVHCITDLTDNEVEVNVVRGITYNVPNPKEVDTYVKVEFPYPQEDPFRAKTPLVKDTDSPDYDQKYIVEFQRTNRQCQRVFKRHAVKFEVYSRGCCLGGFCRKFPMCCFSGFLRSDILIGTVNVKLQPLETKCEIHDSFDLMDGRKAVGGKLEVKIRVRNPILTKQIEHINEKWLILDH